MENDRGPVLGLRALLAGAIGAALLVGGAQAADAPIRPDPRLTPGAIATTDTMLSCQPGYAKSVRHTLGKLKAEIYRDHIDRHDGQHYEIDHFIPLSLDGADTGKNLWPQSFDTRPWNAARAKTGSRCSYTREYVPVA
jgi:hypothetical protein